MKPRLLLDEHVSRHIQRQLRLRDSAIEVYRIGDRSVPPRGTLDPEILLWTEQFGCILVTENRSSMPGHITDHLAAGRHFPGIISIRPGYGIGRIVDELYLIWGHRNRKNTTIKSRLFPFNSDCVLSSAESTPP